MVQITLIDDFGNKVEVGLDGYLKTNLDEVKDSVINKGWDYVAVVSGIVGVGKSTLAQKICKYLDPTFNTKDRICFTGSGKNGLLERTSNAKLGQAFMLDESFADLNTKVGKSSEFIKIINHLQLIRQKGLFIILCLPNFFDLSKGIAIFRTSHLFVVYHEKFSRGYFAAFGRDEKRQLYVKGNKFIDYNCVTPNFRARFGKTWIADQKLYDKLKLEHLKSQAKDEPINNISKLDRSRNSLIKFLHEEGYAIKAIADASNLTRKTIYNALALENSGLDKEGAGSVMEIAGE